MYNSTRSVRFTRAEFAAFLGTPDALSSGMSHSTAYDYRSLVS